MLPLGKDTEDILKRRIAAANEIKRLKTVVAQCDEFIAAVLDQPDDEFEAVVREIRGEAVEPGKKKIRWQYGQDEYVIYRRKGNAPSKKIDPIKLLSHNVPAHVIQACTVEGKPGKPGVGIRKVGDRDDDDTD
jgi:hypothetical protein